MKRPRPSLAIGHPSLHVRLEIATAPRADEVAEYVIGGGEFRKLKDVEKRRLTDARLIEHAEETHLWVKDVYDATSGWVHFSPAHVVADWQVEDDGERGAI